MKRVLDIIIALSILGLVSPLLIGAALGIRFSSPGPVLYRASRVGRGGGAFVMYKFRTMHVSQPGTEGAVITAHGDSRIFRFGNVLRKTKIDELPQFLNVLRGEMSIVGPRPEDPKIVAEHYTDWMNATLDVRPGITSPGSIFYYASGEALISEDDPEGSYVAQLLPPKLAIERAYLSRANWISDLVCMAHTAAAIVGVVLNRPIPPLARDRRGALEWVETSAFPDASSP